MPPAKDLFASSSDDDDDELDQQFATASAREKRRDPHAFEKFSKRKGPLDSGEGGARAKVDSDSDSEEGDLHPSEEQPINAPVIKKTKQSDVEESKDATGGIRINKHYAAKYEEVKRQKELRQLTEKYAHRLPKNIHGSGDGDLENEDDDEEDEEDDDAVLLTDDKEIAFAKAFLAIRSAAPGGTGALSKENEQLPSFFPPPEDQLAENNIIFTRAMEQKEAERRRRFTLADEYRRGMTATSGATGEEGEKVDEGHPQGNRKIKPQSAKERQLRESFLKSVADSTETFAVQPVPGSKNSGEHTNEGKRGVARDILAEAFAIHGSKHGKKKNDKKQKLALNDGDDDNHQQHRHDNDNDNDADVEEKPQSEEIEDEDANEAFIRDYFLNELWKPGKSKKQKQKHTPNPKQKKNNEDDASPGNEEHIDEEDEDDDEEEESGNNYAMLAQLAQEEEDERFYADAEAWEREYQDRAYRHQDEAAANIQSFPRPIGEHAAGLLRRTANTSARKEARLRRVQRIEEMRERQVEELKRLKTLKRQEIESQRALIAAVAGLSQGADGSGKSKKKKKKNNNNNSNNNKNNKKGALSGANEDEDEEAIKRVMALWSEKDLDEDFDPKEFDKKMAKLFDEEYYDEKNVDEDEMAFFDEDLDQEADEGDGENESNEDGENEKEGRGGIIDDVPDLYNAESLEEAILMSASADEKTSGGPSAPDPMLRDDPFALLYPSAALRAAEDADFRNAAHRLRASPNDGEDRVAAALQQMRADLSQREKEYWELHHDSTLDGGAVKTRFKYREVPKEDFLLPVEEILARDDRQLNMIVPMSCYAAYLDAEANVRDRARVARRVQKGFRELDKSRRSRRYGDVAKTALVDMDMNETAGQEWAERVRDGLRRSRVENELDEDEVRGAPQVKRQRNEFFAGNGLRGRGRGGPHAQHAGRGKGYTDGNSSARQGERGGRGRNRGR